MLAIADIIFIAGAIVQAVCHDVWTMVCLRSFFDEQWLISYRLVDVFLSVLASVLHHVLRHSTFKN